MPALLALLSALALGACSLGGSEAEDRGEGAAAGQDEQAEDESGGDDPSEPAAPPPDARPRPGEPEQAEQIRAWSIANNAGQFDRAASYFAPNAIVEQVTESRLPDREAAIAFNKSLPCRAEVTDVKEEGDSFVAAFELSAGRGGGPSCAGNARVRFRFRGGEFSEWRQLAEPATPQGEIA